MARLVLHVLCVLATAASFSLPSPHALARARFHAPAARPLRSWPVAAVPPDTSRWPKWVRTVASRATQLNTAGLEYGWLFLLSVCSIFLWALNTFLWVFRYVIERSGLAPSSWRPNSV